MASIRTACTYDCPDACSLIAEVDGESVRLRGDPDHPITRGFVCYRVRDLPRRLRHAERLRVPLMRRGSSFDEVSWEQALDATAERLGAALRESGPASVLLVRSGGSLGLRRELIAHFFYSLGPVTAVRGGVCGEAGEEAQRVDFGDLACHDYSDLEHAAAVVLWGKDPVASSVHQVPFIKRARERGAPVMLINPLPVESRRLADRWIQVAPAGDGWLALGVLRLLHERRALHEPSLSRAENWPALERLLLDQEVSPTRCAERAGVSLDEMQALADLYSGCRPVATWLGWGLQRCASGGRNLRCIDALALLSGNVGVPGGGVNFTSWRRRGLDHSLLASHRGRTVAAPTLARDLLALDHPKLKFVYVACANPVTQHPDSLAVATALRRCGFVVVADAFLTDTARAADLVLPIQIMLEGPDVVGSYQHHHVAVGRRVLAPLEGTRDDLEILRELGRRLGLAADPLLDDPEAALARLTALWFPSGPAAPGRNPCQPQVPFRDRFATASGRAHLIDELPELPAGLGAYPLHLLTPSCRQWQTSQRLEQDQSELPECRVHPASAAAAGLTDAGEARLLSPLGELRVRLRLDPSMRREVCAVARGGWVSHGGGVNVLVEARATDLGEGAAFYDQRVRLARC